MMNMDYSLLIALKEAKEKAVLDERERLEIERRKMQR